MRVTEIQTDYDLVIIGGGLVGASFACLAAQAMAKAMSRESPRILVTEAIASLQSSTSFDARSTALSFGSQQIYRGLGLWDALAGNATPIAKIHVSDRGHFGAVRMDSEALGVEALGQVLENQHLGVVLTGALEQSPAIDYLCPASVTALVPVPQGMEIEMTLPDGNTSRVCAGLVVLADGGKSPLTATLGIASQVTRYEQSAVIANVAFSDSHCGVAYERFTDTGPLAVLPLSSAQGEGRGALVWTVPTHEAEAMRLLSDREFLAGLQKRFGYRLGTFTRVGSRAIYPLSLSTASEQVRPGLVLLGNVAHTLHPVAGQGLNLALRDAEALARVLSEALADGQPLGAMAVLQDYVKHQQRDQSATIHFSHYMTRLFSSTNPALVWARKFGLFSIDLVPPLKREFARQAMGLADRMARRA